MSPERREPSISRVMIELGGISDGGPIIDTACNLAAAIQAELYGLFVEEESLHDLSGLPFARAILPGRTRPQTLSPELVHETFAKQAAALRRALSASAGSARVSWKFDTTRGHGISEIRAKTSESDIVVVQQHRVGQSASDLMTAARDTAAAARGVVVIGRRINRAAGPVVAIDDGDDTGLDTVAMAASLARRLDAPVELLVVAAGDEAAGRIRERDLALLEGLRVTAVHRLTTDLGEIENALAGSAARFVVADLEGEPFGDNESAARLVRAARAPIVLIRARPAK